MTLTGGSGPAGTSRGDGPPTVLVQCGPATVWPPAAKVVTVGAGATVIGHNGKPFTSASIGGAIATRAIMADLRAGGDAVGGPAPFAKADRSRFLQALDEALVRLSR